jgi:hypothetical protein
MSSQGGQKMLTPSEQDWVLCMIHTCRYPDVFTDGNMMQRLKAVAKSAFEVIVGNEKDVNDALLPGAGQWVLRMLKTSPRGLFDNLPHPDLMGFARRLLESKRQVDFSDQNVLSVLLHHMRDDVKSITSLANTNLFLNVDLKQREYDPFGERVLRNGTSRGISQKTTTIPSSQLSEASKRRRPRLMLGNVTIPASLNSIRDDALANLAKYAFNSILGTARGARFRHKTSIDSNFQQWSMENNFSSSRFLNENCVSGVKNDDGQYEYSVNHINYDNNNRKRLVGNLALNEDDYVRLPFMHSEIRVAERAEGTGDKRNLYIDKNCCVFCTVQLIAMGQDDRIKGTTWGTLQWYTFTPYVMYFKTRRQRLWGADVENIFNKFTPMDKMKFLNFLSKCCRSERYPDIPAFDAIKDSLLE